MISNGAKITADSLRTAYGLTLETKEREDEDWICYALEDPTLRATGRTEDQAFLNYVNFLLDTMP